MTTTKLSPEAQAIKDTLVTHIRMISYDPAFPLVCACGWKSEGKRKGGGFYDHVARKAAARIITLGQSCPTPNPHTIEMHRAKGEALCAGCRKALSVLQ